MPWLGRALERRGVLGINRRNADLISLHNPRRLFPLVDDKLLTKRLAVEAGIAVPELYGVIDAQHQIRRFPELVAERESFVLKPAHGSGGNGIFVIAEKRESGYLLTSGELVDEEELEHHLSNALSGLYSLGGHRDRVMIEYRVRFDPLFAKVSFQGVPDVRTIVYRGVPVMSMARLPTRMSKGKANLHQGAVGVGIDLATGTTLTGVLGNERITQHPDTGNPLAGLRIRGWDAILELAARCHDITGLGYLGVDVVLDRDLGPLLLELNARPGLNIQIANGSGLLAHLQRVDRAGIGASLAERLEFARAAAGEVEP